ncbi:hypothetical protein AMTR_s00030p00233100 [Amborella trichopoda]|uniref:Uncharacterized protein n=1 Tax=Amborella trichopoda TaxID=13333 RepID=U5D1R4_AMBTC|nr:hypothetical protein AMTR_s00030p00233100 [Amborella trichopoda]
MSRSTAGAWCYIARALWLQRLYCRSELSKRIFSLSEHVLRLPKRCGQSTAGAHIVTVGACIRTAGMQSSIAGELWLQRIHYQGGLVEHAVVLSERVIRMSERCGSDKVLPDRILGLLECLFTVGNWRENAV